MCCRTAVTAIVAPASGATVCAVGDPNLNGPSGENPYTITAASAATYAPLPTNFNFNALGQPVDVVTGLPRPTQTISITGLNNIVVEADTGYVH